MTPLFRAAMTAAALMPPLATHVRAETPEQWIALGARVHGGFGAFLPVGIRIGLDALARLNAEPRGVAVMFYSGAKAQCPCIADGVMLASQSSPGQGTLQIAADKAPAGLLALVVVSERKSRKALSYTVKDEWLAKVIEWNKTLDPAGRYRAAMEAVGFAWPRRPGGAARESKSRSDSHIATGTLDRPQTTMNRPGKTTQRTLRRRQRCSRKPPKQR